MNDLSYFTDSRVLITGGAGMIGSTIARLLVEQGAEVTVVDALLPAFGGNRFNLQDIFDRIVFVKGDIRNLERVKEWVDGADYVFSLAAQVSYVDSNHDPLLDLDIDLGMGTFDMVAHMVVVEVGDHDSFDGLGAEFQAAHVGEQHLAVGAGIEQDRLAQTFDQAGKPPAGLKVRKMRDVVEHDCDSQPAGLGWMRIGCIALHHGQGGEEDAHHVVEHVDSPLDNFSIKTRSLLSVRLCPAVPPPASARLCE